jgi:hypothetical protein
MPGVVGVLIFDFITGPILSSALFRISFGEAAIERRLAPAASR